MKKEFEFGNNKIDIEYDETKFDILFIESEQRIVVKRLSDNVLLKSFIDVGFVIQTEIDGKNHFIVSDYSKYKKDLSNDIELMHYREEPHHNKLSLVEEFDIGSVWLNQQRIMNNVYLINPRSGLNQIYNLKETSMYFDKIYFKEDVISRFDEKTILVNRKITADFNHEISDLLTYGINPETYEIVTPIWSELQQRCITVYTDEEREQLNQKRIKQGYPSLHEKMSNEEATIIFEVQRYLDILGDIFGHTQNVYDSSGCKDEVNDEFVKKFINNRVVIDDLDPKK